MEHVTVVNAFVAVILLIGACHLLPTIVEQFLAIVKSVLQIVATFIKWFREWKRDLWPHAKKAHVDKAA